MSIKNEIIGWRTRLYVGAPNNTHRISVSYAKKINDWAASVKLQGYTVYRATGYWQGQAEDTAVIEVMGFRITRHMISALRATLGQEAIYMTMEKIRGALVQSPE
jgi:hypothetical protein